MISDEMKAVIVRKLEEALEFCATYGNNIDVEEIAQSIVDEVTS